MSRRQRQRDEIEALCARGSLARAVDLAYLHFADFGRDDALVELIADALDRTSVTAVVARRFEDLRRSER
jgi:hypothetical protein